MLEGQVAVLSSGYLTSEPELASAGMPCGSSALYRPDQNSYMLYPNKELPRFLQKNTMEESAVAGSPLLKKLVADGNLQLITRNVMRGDFILTEELPQRSRCEGSAGSTPAEGVCQSG